MNATQNAHYTESDLISAVKRSNIAKQEEVDNLKAALKTAHEEIESLSSQLHNTLTEKLEIQEKFDVADGRLAEIKESFTQFHNLVGTPIKKA